MSDKLYIFDCLSKKLRVSDASFMTIGRGPGSVFRCKMRVELGGTFALQGCVCRFFPHLTAGSYSFNGKRTEGEVQLLPGSFNLFVLEGGCFIGWVGDESSLPDFSSFSPDEWYVYDKGSGRWSEAMRLGDVATLPESPRGRKLVVFKGLVTCAFELEDIRDVARFEAEERGELPRSGYVAGVMKEGGDQENDGEKEVRCPHCWQRFLISQALAVSAHPKLRGDSILGEGAQQRFTPVNLDRQGVPVDAMGLSVREYACPWCHHKLPPFFMKTRQMIFSLVGMPGSGKTYYLTTMLQELEYALSREFGIAFRDSDLSGNASINSMRTRLFSADSPQDAILARTLPAGELYHDVWRDGRYVRVPRPFVYSLSRESKTCSVTLYDTAGTGYETNEKSGENDAGHLEAASAIFFLFDPTADIAFRKIIKSGDSVDKSGGRRMRERQALMLSDVEMKLRSTLHLPPEKRLSVPLAIIIGKSDVWQDLLGPEPLLPSVRNGQFQPKFVDANSKRLREFLFNISPNICTNAETVSNNVRYFAVSSFGGETTEITDAQGEAHCVPANGKVKPNRVIDPVLWALHCKDPDLLRRSHS